MQYIEWNYTFNSPQDQDGGPGDLWVVALVTADQKATLAPEQRVLCSSGPTNPFVGVVLSIGETPNGEERHFVVIAPEEG